MKLDNQLPPVAAKLLNSRVFRNFSYLLGAEGVARIIRIVATIAMARALDISDFGVLAIALTCHELIAVSANNGFGLFLLKQDDSKYLAAANSVWILSWAWALLMFVLQLVAGHLVQFVGSESAAALIIAMAPIQLILPLALTQVYVIHRSGKLGAFAGVTSLQNLVDCVLTIALLFLGFGIWAIVIAKIASTFTWVVGIRRFSSWEFNPTAGFVSLIAPFQYSASVLFSEYGKSIRHWGDNLIVGAFMGAELLGIYYFAKNSGLGISLGLSQVCITTATPKFAELTRSGASLDQVARQRKNLVVSLSLLMSALIVCQAVLAPLYVPLLFGSTWIDAVPVLAILCLSAIPRCIAELHASLARNSDLAMLEVRWNAGYTVAFLLMVAVASQNDLYSLAWATVALNLATALWIINRTWQELWPKTNQLKPSQEYL